MDSFDTAIVGGGPAGIFTAFALIKYDYKGDIALFEWGKDRKLSDLNKPSRVKIGWGGAGGISDGKLNLTIGQGGQLRSLIGEEALYHLLKEIVLPRYLSFGDGNYKETITNKDHRLISEAAKEGLVLLPSHIVHFGTDGCQKIMGNMHDYLKDKIDISLETRIKSVEREGDGFVLTTAKGKKYYADNVVLGAGRIGNDWEAEQFRGMGVEIIRNGSDIGLRFEEKNDPLKKPVLEELIECYHEAKFIGMTHSGMKVRSFCMSPGGYVINEGGQPNGGSYLHKQSDNTNLAILVTLNDIENPSQYLKRWKSMPKQEYGKPILVERYGDFKEGVSNPILPDNNEVRPTLDRKYFAVGDIHRVLPPEIDNPIIEFIEKIGIFVPGFNNRDNLLYAVEVKDYSLQMDIIREKDKSGLPVLRTIVPGAYPVGDGSGWTEGLSNASLSGYSAGAHIAQNRPA